jgi:hypothetical protein
MASTGSSAFSLRLARYAGRSASEIACRLTTTAGSWQSSPTYLELPIRVHVTAGQQSRTSGLKDPDRGTRPSAAPMGARPRRKEEIVYIGLGTVVVIIVIVAVVMILRRR